MITLYASHLPSCEIDTLNWPRRFEVSIFLIAPLFAPRVQSNRATNDCPETR